MTKLSAKQLILISGKTKCLNSMSSGSHTFQQNEFSKASVFVFALARSDNILLIQAMVFITNINDINNYRSNIKTKKSHK